VETKKWKPDQNQGKARLLGAFLFLLGLDSRYEADIKIGPGVKSRPFLFAEAKLIRN